MANYRIFIFIALVFFALTMRGSAQKHLLTIPDSLSIQRLASACKLWGVLKYYHPIVSDGKLPWDSVLISLVPQIIASGSNDDYQKLLKQMITTADSLPHPPMFFTQYDSEQRRSCDTVLTENLRFWAHERSFAPEVRERVFSLLQLRMVKQHYAFESPGTTIYPRLDRENPYESSLLPDMPHRLLALFRYWNFIQYFYPHFYTIENDWSRILTDFIPRFFTANDTLSYHLTVLELTARLRDSHQFTQSKPLEAYRGEYFAPFNAQIIDDQLVVSSFSVNRRTLFNTGIFTSLALDSLARAQGIRIGDEIVSVDGVPVSDLKSRLQRTIGASNEASLRRDMGYALLRGTTNQITLQVSDGETMRNVISRRYTVQELKRLRSQEIESAWRFLNSGITYVDINKLRIADLSMLFAFVGQSKGIVFDCRQYPASPPKTLCQGLARYFDLDSTKKIWRTPLMQQPGAFCRYQISKKETEKSPSNFFEQPVRYAGKIVILVNQTTQSAAEYVAMELQTIPNAKTIGSQTAGALGVAPSIVLPGNIQTLYTAEAIFYPDGTPTQHTGLKIDIRVEPTIAGIRAGRDEVLDKGIEVLQTMIRSTNNKQK